MSVNDESTERLFPLLRHPESGAVIGGFFTSREVGESNSLSGRWHPLYLKEELTTVEIPVHTLTADGTIEREMRKKCAAVLYVESLPGGVAETGDGSRENPYVNLAGLFVHEYSTPTAAGTRLKCLARTMGCAGGVVLIKVAGVVDYPVPAYSRYHYGSNVVLDFSECEVTENFAMSNANGITVMNFITARQSRKYEGVFFRCTGCTFYNCRYTASGEAHNDSLFYLLTGCSVDSCHAAGHFGSGAGGPVLALETNYDISGYSGYSTMYGCTAEVTAGSSFDGVLQAVDGTVLQDCSIQVEVSSEDSLYDVFAVGNTADAIFNNCTAVATAISTGANASCAAFRADDSTFAGCTGRGMVYAAARGRGCGFYGFRNAFSDCVADNHCIGSSNCSECAL